MSLLPRARPFDLLRARHGARYNWIVLFIVGLGTVAGVLCTSSFNVAVPALTRHFGLGQDQVQWTMTGFMAAMTVAMLPTAWLLDRIGLRTVFLLALAVLTAASVAGFFAPGFTLVVAARVLQGMAAGVLQPLGVLALMRLFPAETRGRAAGILTVSIAFTPAVAPALAGLLLDRFGWQAIFLLGVPFGIVASAAALWLLPAPRQIVRRRFDWAGLGWLTVATLALIEGVASLHHSGLRSPWTWGQAVLALVATVLFVRHAARIAEPLIHLGLFGERTFAMGTLVSFSYGFGLYASTYLVPVFLQNALSFGAGSAGMALMPAGIALILTLPVAGRLADRFAPKWVTLAGLAAFGLSFVLFGLEAGHIGYTGIIVATVVGRIGLGLILPALNLATLHHLEPHQLGQSSVVISYARQLGGVMGVAIVAVFVEWRERIHGSTPPGIFDAYAQSFLLLAGVFALAIVAAARMRSARA